MSDLIPDEAVRAAAQARLGPSPSLEVLPDGPLAYEMNKAQDQLEAAAPFIVRAAQVAILREMADEDEQKAKRLEHTLYGIGVKVPSDSPLWGEQMHHYRSAQRLRAKADELEGGA
jgi:hypothetical protein